MTLKPLWHQTSKCIHNYLIKNSDFRHVLTQRVHDVLCTTHAFFSYNIRKIIFFGKHDNSYFQNLNNVAVIETNLLRCMSSKKIDKI